MRITLINPNITTSMTDMIDAAAKRVAAPDTEITTITSSIGPDALETKFDEFIAIPGVLKEVLRIEKEKSADAIIVACYGDPGLQAAKEIASIPVIGIAQASMYFAALVAAKFSIVTDLSSGVEGIEELVRNYGMERLCVSVRATEVPVLGFEEDHNEGLKALEEHSLLAMKNDGAEAICLACAGLVGFTEEMQKDLGIPVFDGVIAAVKLAEGLVSMGKTTSKYCTYKTPPVKKAAGMAAEWMDMLAQCK